MFETLRAPLKNMLDLLNLLRWLGTDGWSVRLKRFRHIRRRAAPLSSGLSGWGILVRPWGGKEGPEMLYSILCYESEALAAGRTRQEDDAMMVRLRDVQQSLKAEGKLGPVARLMPTTTATHIRSGKDPMVIDGPFAETKEQLLGFYVVDCPTLEEAIDAAKRLAREKPNGTLEIRPVAVFNPVGPSK
jgi:hypothetical protein